MSKKYIQKKEFNEIIENINKRLETLETNNLETQKQTKYIIDKIEKSNEEYNNKLDKILESIKSDSNLINKNSHKIDSKDDFIKKEEFEQEKKNENGNNHKFKKKEIKLMKKKGKKLKILN